MVALTGITSIKETARLTHTHPQTVRRIALRSGRHGQVFHQAKAQQLKVRTLEMDERHGYVEDKTQQLWDAVSIDATSKFIVQLEVGERTEALFEALMRHSAEPQCRTLRKPAGFVVDNRWSTALSHLVRGNLRGSLHPPHQHPRGRPPKQRYRIPRTLAHVQGVKHTSAHRLVAMEIVRVHGSWTRIEQGLAELGTSPAHRRWSASMPLLVA